MEQLAEELRSEIDASYPRLRALTEAEVSGPRAAGKWSRKEILGHLIDSAANNHQRFVRAQLVDAFQWPGYEQDEWVRAHGYRDHAWSDLLGVWMAGRTDSRMAGGLSVCPSGFHGERRPKHRLGEASDSIMTAFGNVFAFV